MDAPRRLPAGGRYALARRRDAGLRGRRQARPADGAPGAERAGRHARGAGEGAGRAQGAHPHQQHQSHPRHRFGRTRASWMPVASKWPGMACTSSCRGQHEPCRHGSRRIRTALRDKDATTISTIRSMSRCTRAVPVANRSRAGWRTVLLPGQHPAEGRGDPGQLSRPRGPPRVDPAYPRPRRRPRRGGRHRGLAASGGSGGPGARAGAVRGAGAARRALRRRRLRQLRPSRQLAGGGEQFADRTLRPADPPVAAGQLAAPLSVDRGGRLRVFPQSPGPGPARRRARPADHPGALSDPRGTGTHAGYPAIQAGRVVEHARRDEHGLRTRTPAVPYGDPRAGLASGLAS